jgi:hypothetical protein
MHLFYTNTLIFNFLMSSACFEPECSSSGSRLYTQAWYGVFQHVKHMLYMLKHTLPNCIYDSLPEDEPSGSKHVQDVKN